jgi:type IV pilus assembly protein PilY1
MNNRISERLANALRGILVATALVAGAAPGAFAATTNLADQPFFIGVTIPGNVALVMSVEYPTATSIGNGIVPYSSSKLYYGYFDSTRCYVYNTVTTKAGSATGGSYFSPAALSSTTDYSCPNASTNHQWSGNFLNWASMSTIDPFRYVLTGGYRSIDTATTTILEKAWSGSQAAYNETPPMQTSLTTYANVTPMTSWSTIWTNIHNMGQYMCFTSTGHVDGGYTSTGTWTSGSSGYLQATGSANGASYTGASSSNWSGTLNNATEYSSGTSPTAGGVTCVEVRVQVCNPSAPTGVEANCTAYSGGNYKPEGLIQKYSQLMRFADFGYLLDNAGNGNVGVRDGGVMRARMEYVGPMQPVPGSTSITNPNAEWSSTTGQFIANPDATDVTNTLAATGCSGGHCTINNSGVVNYLNMFGEHARSLGNTSAYKSGDNVSELYYTATRYFKELGNVPEYTALYGYNTDLSHSDCVTSADQCVDGFPVITNWYPADSSAPRGYDFPIQYSCQKNFIVGIGDANTHFDGNLPGTYAAGGAALSNPGLDAAYEPPLESLVSSTGGTACTSPSTTPCSDTTVDTTLVTNWIGYQEGTVNGHAVTLLNPLGQTPLQSFLGCCGGATFYLSGLAYDAHVHDLIPNAFVVNGSKSQIQTLSTYFVDVLEYGTFYNQNQYWMAAKYGGFTVPAGYTEFCSPVSGAACAATTAWPTSMWASLGRQVYNGSTPYTVPDNYYSGRDSAAMVSGLNNAFQAIATATTAVTTTALGLSTAQVSGSNNVTYAAYYDPTTWTGQFQAYNLSYDANGNPLTPTVYWSGRDNLQAQVTASSTAYNSNRKIATWTTTVGDTTTGSAVAFQAANLGANELVDLVPPTMSGATAANVVAYLRGDSSNEGSSGLGIFRTRKYVLGDIVDSQAVPVGRPAGPITSQYNLGYSAFETKYYSRNTVVYVGANDGMLHAFDGSITDSTQGQELWAYVPGGVYAGPSGTPYVNGLVSRTYKVFQHFNFVDATPVTGDVDFDNAGGSFSATNSDWHTILVGGLGKGGMSFYAIDITDPTTMTSESAVAGKVLWEFNQNTINTCPVNICNGSTATIGYSFGPPLITKTAKYGWVVILTSGFDNSDGIGYFFFLNPKTGALLEAPLSTGYGSASSPSGLTYASGFVTNFNDGTSESLYAGDLYGNMWRVDLTPAAGTGAYSTPTLIAVAKDASGVRQPITTRPLIQEDPATARRYVVFGTGKTLASTDLANSQTNTIYSIWDGTVKSGGFLTSSTLPSGQTFPITRSELQVVTSLATGIPSTLTGGPMGWYIDLAAASGSSSAEQVDVQSTAYFGTAAFGINTNGGSACSPSGTSRVVAFNIATGVSTLTDSSGNSVTSYSLGFRTIGLTFVNVSQGSIRLMVSTDSSSIGSNSNTGSGTGGTNGSNAQVPLGPTCTTNPCTVNGNFVTNGVSTKLNWRQIKGGN